MWVELIALFLGVSVLLYALLGGADFGAGILELFPGEERRKEQRELTSHAMGPVWEANHMWLILALVILFNGFPAAFRQISVSFHIPLTVMLLGVVFRGCAFVFRSYDVVKDRSQDVYSLVFSLSSVVAAFMLGVLAGALTLGWVDPGARDFATAYLTPWLNAFCFAVGFFVCALFSFLASVYLVGETEDPRLRDIFIQKAKVTNVVALLFGLAVFGAAESCNYPLIRIFFGDPWSALCMLLATGLLYPLWRALGRQRVHLARLLVGVQVAFVVLGWLRVQYPFLIAMRGVPEKGLTLFAAAAPQPTLYYLLLALVAGSVVIFPSLFYLFRVFKRSATPSLR